MKKYNVVLWDTDGTLLDTKYSILRAIDWTAKQEGLRDITEEELESFFGPPAFEHFIDIFHISDEQAMRMLKTFRKRYNDEELFKTDPFPHVLDTMKELKKRGYKQGIASYKSEPSLSMLMEHFTFDKIVDKVAGGCDEIRKTKSGIMQECLEALSIDKKDYDKVLMIGDSMHDYNGAKEVGCDFLGVTYGVGFDDITKDEKEAKMCIGFCDDAKDILKYLP